MANYKDIHGTTVRNSAGNLSGAKTGELFYDSTNVDFKYQFPNLINSWRTSVPLNTARTSGGAAGLGTVTAGLFFGGYISSPTPRTGATESWNGSTWTSWLISPKKYT